MRAKLLLVFCLLGNSILFSQSGDREYNRIYKEGKFNTGSEDAVFIITDLDSEIPPDNIVLIHDNFNKRVFCEVTGFIPGEGFRVKVKIGYGADLIGEKNRLNILNKTDSKLLGYVQIPIGVDEPRLSLYDNNSSIPLGNPSFFKIQFKGRNLDGVTEVLSVDNKVWFHINRPYGKTDTTFYLDTRAESVDPLETTSYRLVYKTFDSKTFSLKTDTTDKQTTYIKLYRTSLLQVRAIKDEFLLEDVKRNNMVLRISNMNTGKIVACDIDRESVKELKLHEMSDGDTIGKDVLIQLFFDDVEVIKPGKYKLNFTLKEGAITKKYLVQFIIHGLPEVSKIYNKSKYNKYLITKERKQTITFEGSRLRNCKIIPSNIGVFNIGEAKINKDDELEFPIEVINLSMEEQKYSFDLVVENDVVVKRFTLDFEHPQIPQKIEELYKIETTASHEIDGKHHYVHIGDKDKNFKIVFDPKNVNLSLGPQSVNVVLNYYNPNGKLIFVRKEKPIIILDGPSVKEVVIDFDNKEDEYVMLYGRVEVVISHSSDYYKQDLESRGEDKLTVHFVRNTPFYINAAFTVPPALIVAGWQQKTGKVEFLPINVGAGFRVSFVQKRRQLYDPIRVGVYAAGINFVDRTVGAGTGGDFIRQGDLAGLILAEFSLRRTESYVKVPFFVGFGATFPIAGVTCRGFATIGVGINL